MDRTEGAATGAPMDGVPPAAVSVRGDRRWPIIIAVALAVVVVVNGIFTYIAVTGSDPVEPSYFQGDR